MGAIGLALASSMVTLACGTAHRPGATIAYRFSPLLSFHSTVWRQAFEPERWAPRELLSSVELIRSRIPQDERTTSSAWETLFPLVTGAVISYEVESSRGIEGAVSSVPDTIGFAGETMPLRAFASAYLAHLVQHLDDYIECHWNFEEARLRQRASELERALATSKADVMAHLCTRLQLAAEGISIPVFVTPDLGPLLFGVTYGGPDSALAHPVTVVALEPSHRLVTVESLVHELLHALDLWSSEETTCLDDLRVSLDPSGVQERSESNPSAWAKHVTLGDMAHILIWVETEHAVRTLFDPHYESPRNNWNDAVAATLRERRFWLSRLAASDIWRQHAEGRVSREVATGVLSAIFKEMLALRLESACQR